jgi:dTDP-4-dehydrorhamnose 3,5-epimerase
VTSPAAEILYKTTDYYHPQSEVCLAWDDLEVGINWPLPVGVESIMSTKDRYGLLLNQLVGNAIAGFESRKPIK